MLFPSLAAPAAAILLSLAVSMGSVRLAWADTPTGVQVVSVSSSAAQFSWVLDNPAAESPLLVISTAADFSIIVSSATGTLGLQATTYYGLNPNTSHYFKVKVSTEPDGNYTVALATVTRIETPSGIYFDIVTASAIVASAYGPALTGLGAGLSGAAVDKDLAGYSAWRTGDRWASKTAMTTARRYFAAAELGGKVYAVGGQTIGETYSAHNEEYDPVANTWAAKAAMPTPRSYLAAAAAGGKLYALGGSSTSATAVNEAYDPESNSWTSKAAMIAAGRSPAAAGINGKIYVIGGIPNYNANQEYDPETNAWVSRTPMPTARYELAAAAVAGKIYALGGTPDGISVLNKNEEYDPAANSWATKAVMPTSRRVLAAAALGGKIYAVGGSPGPTAVNEEYNPAADAWTARAAMPSARFALAAAAAQGRIYAVGGYDTGYLGQNVEYDPGVAVSYTGLLPNTQYTFTAKARNLEGTETAGSAPVSTYTLAALPGAPAITARSSGTQNIGWGPGANPAPAGTSYRLKYSISPEFTAAVTTFTVVPSTSATVTGLAPNTSYYYDVAALNGAGVQTAYTGSPASSSTLAAVPGTVSITGSGAAGQSITWATGGNPDPGTSYLLEYSTSADFTPSVTTAAVVTSTFTTVSGLENGTSYYYDVAAINRDGVLTAFTGSPAAGYTLPSAPGAPVPAVLGVSSISWTWAAAQSALSYKVYLASEPATLLAVSASPLFLQPGLSTNSLNGIIVAAVNLAGESGLSPAVSTYTSAAVPLNLSTGPMDNGTNSIEVQWDGKTNPSGTQYRVDYWPDGGSTSTVTTDLAYTLVSGLTESTSYYFTVRARNEAGVFTEAAGPLAALTMPGAPTGLTGEGWTADSIQWNWNAVPTATRYNIYSSTCEPVTLIGTTVSNSFMETGLSTNTSYGVMVTVVNLVGESDRTAKISTHTLAAIPGGPVIAVSSDTSQDITWDGRGNPAPGTDYRLKYSTEAAFTASVTTTAVVSSTFTKVAGLVPNTTYYYDVAAVNNSGVATAYTGAPASSCTLAAVPGTPDIFGATEMTQGAAWSANGNPGPGTAYRLKYSTSPDFDAPVTTTVVLSSTFTTITDLAPNRPYYYAVAAVNLQLVQTEYSGPSAGSYTLAAVPGNPAFTDLSTTTQSLEWSAGGNPDPGTNYFIEYSTSPGFEPEVSTAAVVSSTFTKVTGLAPGTSYYYRVAGINNTGFHTAYAGFTLAGYTLPSAPEASTGVAIGASSISWTWAAVQSATGYKIYAASEPATAIAAVSSNLFIETGLSTNTSNGILVSAVNPGGEGAKSPAVSTYTLAAVPGAPVITARSSTTQNIAWGDGTNPFGTRYLVEYSTSPDFAPAVTTTTVRPTEYFYVNGLQPGTSYYFDVAAINADGIPTAFTGISTAGYTLPPAPDTLTAGAMGVSSISWTWAASTSAVSYRIYVATEPATLLAAMPAPPFVRTGLSTNTLHGILVSAVNLAGEGSKTQAASAYTLANAPGAPAILARSSATQVIAWSSATNPSGTGYRLEYSTSPDFAPAVTTVAVVTSTFATVAELSAGTSYYYDVAALNGDNIPTAFTGVSTAGYTLPAAPAALTAAALGVSSVSWTWALVDSAVSYKVYVATEPATVLTALPAPPFVRVGLFTNTLQGVLVSAVNLAGEGAQSAEASVHTLAAIPGTPAITARSSATQSIAWDGAGNPAPGTSYLLKYSTSPDFAAAVSTLAVVDSTYPVVTGLLPRTSYFYDVAALNSDGIPTAFTGLSTAGYTTVGMPGAPAITHRSSSTQTVAWGGGGNPDPGTSYRLKYSTSADFTASVTTMAVAASTFTTVGGLTSNTSYYYDVAAFNEDGSLTGYTGVPAAGYTLVAVPGAPLITGRSSTTQSVAWGDGGNPDPGTSYGLRYSTSPDFTLTVTTLVVAASTFTTVTGLMSGTSYYYDVAAYNAGGNLTAFTGVPTAGYTLPARPEEPAGTALGLSSISWTWAAVESALSYNIYPDTAPSTVIAAVTSPLFTWTGLSTNTLNGILVSAVNPAGEGAGSVPASTYTLAAVPLNLSVSSGTVTKSTITVRWDANTNLPGTSYRVDYSTESGVIYTSMTVLTTATFSGLAESTTYYFWVRAANAAGLLSAPAVYQIPTLPGFPAARPVGTAAGADSISWTWSLAPTAIGYNVYPSSEPATLIATVAAPPYLQGGLLANATYSIMTRVVNEAGMGLQSPAAITVRTFARPPAGETVSDVYITSAVIAWGLNSNPANTQAEVERSVNNSTYGNVFAGADTGYTDTGLLACTSYYYRIRNRNNSGVYTAYSSTLNFLTKGVEPLAPGSLSAETLSGNRISLSWEPSLSGQATLYSVYFDSGTGTIDYNVALATVAASASGYITDILPSSSSYRFGLRANLCGTEEANISVTASAASTATLAGLSAAIKVPQAGRKVSGNSVAVMAELVQGQASQAKQVSFQYKASTSAQWLDLPAANPGHPNPDTGSPYLVHWNVISLSSGSYDLRAMASDLQDSPDPAPAAISVVVDPADPDIYENTQAGNEVKKEQKVHNAVANTVQAWDGVSDQVTRLELPAGAFSASTVTVSVTNNPVLAPSAPSTLQACGAVTQIGLSNGQTLLSGGKTAAVTLSFADANNDGIVDGTEVRTETLQMYSAETLAGPWKKDFASVVNLAGKTVTGNTPHFSFFALFAPLGADMDSIEVFPVPFMPNDGDPDNGANYVAGDFTTGIVFNKLPSSVRIKIYTVTGQLVANFASENTSGALQWDVKNEAGKPAASGGYIAVISSQGRKDAVRKILVVR